VQVLAPSISLSTPGPPAVGRGFLLGENMDEILQEFSFYSFSKCCINYSIFSGTKPLLNIRNMFSESSINYWEKGDDYESKVRNENTKKVERVIRKRTSSKFELSSIENCESNNLSDHITWLIGRLNNAKNELFTIRNDNDFETTIFMYFKVFQSPNGFLVESDKLIELLRFAKKLETRNFSDIDPIWY